MLRLILFFVIICSFNSTFAISILSSRGMTLGSTVTVQGTVLNGSELGNSRYIDDGTAGIVVYSTTMLGSVKRGDIISVTGTLVDFNNLLEIVPTTVNVISSNNPLPAPIVLTCAAAFNETYESRLVEIHDVNVSSATNAWVGNTNYTINDITGSGLMRINNNTNIPGEIIPCGNTNYVGIMSQYFADYQLLPRSIDDIHTFDILQSNISTNSFSVNFTLPVASSYSVNYGTLPSSLSMSVTGGSGLQHTSTLSGLSPATVYYVQVVAGSYQSCIIPMMTASNSPGTILAYFNNPVDHTVSSSPSNNAVYLNYTFDDTIAAYIDRCQSTLSIAIYNMNINPVLVNAINDAHNRGVLVNMLFDQSVDVPTYNSILIPTAQKIYAPTASSSFNIMHNKFVILDKGIPLKATVITGSTNWTLQQLETDKNNLLIINDQSVAIAYQMEFDEMFVDGLHGASKSNNTPHEFNVGGKRVEVYFSPSDGVQELIKRKIKQTDFDIYFAVMAFTRYDIAQTIKDSVLIPKGAFCAGIVNDTASSTLVYQNITAEGDAFIIYNGTLSNIFHHKYLISDPSCANSDPFVLTGSHNWSQLANTKNDENTIVIHDSLIANQYYQEFMQRYKDLSGSVFPNVTCVVGINESLAVTFEFTIVPNPANETLQIQSDETFAICNIYDVYGKLCMQNTYSEKNKTIDISTLKSGIYIIEMQNAKGKSQQKLVKL